MEFFQLHHPLNATVLCDRKGCEQVSDYLDVDDHGHEYRVCAMHTDSKTHGKYSRTRASLSLHYGETLGVRLRLPPSPSPALQALAREHCDERGVVEIEPAAQF